jgi:hypothetical protein
MVGLFREDFANQNPSPTLDLERNTSQVADYSFGEKDSISTPHDNISFPPSLLPLQTVCCSNEALHLKVFELIAKLSTEVDWNGAAIDENWIQMIPCLIQILFLLLSPQDDALRIEVSSLIHKIALKITDSSQLNLLPLPDSNGDNNNHGDDDHRSRQPCLDDALGAIDERAPDSLQTYFKITLGPMGPGSSSAPTSTPPEMREHGLGVVRHLRRIEPSFLSTEASKWSRDDPTSAALSSIVYE